jgi:hypothetical protein
MNHGRPDNLVAFQPSTQREPTPPAARVTIACTRTGARQKDLVTRLSNVLRDSGLESLAISAQSSGWLEGMAPTLCLVVVAPNEAECAHALLEIRKNLDLALSPVIACLPTIAPMSSIDPFVRLCDHADAVLDYECTPSEIAAALTHARRITSALSKLRPLSTSLSFSARRRALILRYFTSRGTRTLSPQRDPLQPAAHCYGLLDVALGSMLVPELEALASRELLDREFFERVHVCPECKDARLLFREVCARCRSADLRRGDVIHHYRCGHVAPEEAYRRASELLCPSCSHPLRHIGIDYERPASIVFCNSCGMRAAEGTTEARCSHCEGVHLPSALPERIIWKYVLTEAGRTAAIDPAAEGAIDDEPDHRGGR